ncbi:MAG: hypothetical protein NUV83_02035 [Candidatus Wolfebacteria bacterium]|nr:hypothetical protein [Candidatus Wolfebacteria bacterium]
MENKSHSEPSLQERIDVLLARADSLAADISGLSLNDEEKEIFKEIQEFRDKIGSNKEGEVVDVYNGEELKQAQRAKDDLWDLKKIILERLSNEAINAPKPQEKQETAGDVIPDKIKNDPDFQKVQKEIEERVAITVRSILKPDESGKPRGYRGSEEDVRKKVRVNIEIDTWKKFVKENLEKSQQWAEFIPIIKPILERLTGLQQPVSGGEKEGVIEGIGNRPKNAPSTEIERGKDFPKKPKDEFAKFGNKTRPVLTDDEMRTIATAKPPAAVDEEKLRKEGWEQATRVVDKLTDERISEAKKNAQHAPEELEEKRKQEAADLGIPTAEFYNEADKERALKEEAEKLGILTITEKTKEKISTEQEVKMFDKKVVEGFSELGISSDEVSKIEGFETLSIGQQHLILDGFRQFVFGQIKEQALEKYNQEVKESGFFKKIGKGITKKYQIAKLEKTTAKDLLSSGLSRHEKILKQLTKAIREQGVDAIVNENGEVEIQYASLLDKLILNRLNPEDNGKIETFNKSATALSKIPYEWSLGTASKKQRQEFEKIKKDFEMAKMEILNLPSARAAYNIIASNLIDIENKLRFSQFISVHPEVEKELSNIQTQSAWTKIRKDIITERGIYAGVGFGAAGMNAAIMLASGFILPIGTVVSGAAIARWRAKEALNEQDIMARKSAGFPEASEEQQKILKEKSKELAEKEEWLKARFPEYVKAENDYLEEIIKLNKKEKVEEAPTAQEVELLEQLKSKYETERLRFEIDPLFQEYSAKKSEYEKLRNGIFKKEKGDEMKQNVASADSLTNKIENLIKKVETEKDVREKEKLIESLKVRLDYSDEKLREGLVNFGSSEERFLNNYNLIKSISNGFVFTDSLGNSQINKELQQRLDRFLSAKKEKISKARKDHIRMKMELGALYAIGFYGLGFYGRKAFSSGYNLVSDWWQSFPKTSPTVGGVGEYAMPSEKIIGKTGQIGQMSGGKLTAGVGVGAGVEALAPAGTPKAESLMQEIQAQPIGKRGPEGAIIDYFKKNEWAARQFGYDEHMDINKWAGTKAHWLWLKHAQDAIKDPNIEDTLKKLGYAPEDYINGYEEMMRHVSNGGVKIDISKGNVDLIDMDYLKFKAGGLEDAPSGIQIDEGSPISPQIDEGTFAVENNAVEAIDNAISISALPSVEKFVFSDRNFSVGEFSAIKNISVEKLLKEIPSRDEAWAIWRGEVEGKSINLPHYETYWYTQFKRQVNLAEQIRQIAKAQKIKPEILKNISIGKFIEKYIAPGLKK